MRQQMSRRDAQPEEVTETGQAEEVPALHQEVTPTDPSVVPGCGPASGTRFNLEPRRNAKPQSSPSVDFLRNRVAPGIDLVVGSARDIRGFFGRLGGSDSGYYVSRGADCAAEFEGGLPRIDGLTGFGNAVVAADPARDAFFIADVRLAEGNPNVGVVRSSATTLLHPTACPPGTHSAAQAATCWPTTRLLPDMDSPHLALDERTGGVGAGNVYIAGTKFDFNDYSSHITLVACTNTLTTCSAPTRISGADSAAQFAHVAVRPDGRITLTWINVPTPTTFEIKYRSCTPSSAPAAPRCGAASLVHTETHPLTFEARLAAHHFKITTHPKHDHRLEAHGTETYVVWERCRVLTSHFWGRDVCPDADVVMKASKNNGGSWSEMTCVDCAAQDHFFPAIKTDRSRNIVNLAYYSSTADGPFQHRVRLVLRQILPGNALPDLPADPHFLTTLPNDPSGDPVTEIPFFGEYIGVAARGTGRKGHSTAYVHYIYNNLPAVYHGIRVPEPNNHLSRLDY
jgi:hypothetical protein